jgi:cyclomaltodextrinase
MIYYGDETGMWSPNDPSNRMPTVWQDLEPYDDPQVKFDAGLFAHYQRLIALRNQLPALQLGLYRPLVADDATGVFAFARDLGDARAYVVINRSDREQTVKVPLGAGASETALLNWLDPADADLVAPPAGAPDRRPSLKPRDGAKPLIPAAATVEIRLPPYGSAVLAGTSAHP